MRKLLSILTNRFNLIALFFLLQIAFMVFIILKLTQTWIYFHFISIALGFLISLHMISKDENPIYKLSWIIFLLVTPVFGVLLYFYSRTERLPNSITSRMQIYQVKRENELKKITSKIDENNINEQRFLNNLHFPGYKNTTSKFLGGGIEKQTELIKELKKAEKFIFMEYFIITSSNMWD